MRIQSASFSLLAAAALVACSSNSPSGGGSNDAGTSPVSDGSSDTGSAVDAGGVDAHTGTNDAGTALDSGSHPIDAGSGTDGSNPGSGDGGGDSASSSDASGDAADSGSEISCVTLTVENYADWCSVSIAGGTASSGSPVTACVAPGVVSLSASAASSSWELGSDPWHLTAGDLDGGGDPGTISYVNDAAVSTTTVDVGGDGGCVWICCPDAPSGNGCPASNQCP